MNHIKEYLAFISYKREDIKEAKRLQHALEFYRLPNHLRQERPELPEYVRPVFRDMTDLEVGELSAQIHSALENSHFLIVVCSTRATTSKWVNDEVEYFISLGKAANIIPYIIEGVPHACNPSEECFPSALLELSNEKELLGANVNEVGRDSATIRIVSRMFNIRFDTLYQRYLVEQKKRQRQLAIAITSAFILLSCVVGWIWHQNTLIKEREWELMKTRAHFIAEKGQELIDEQDSYLARLLALEILPKDLDNPDRPYVPEAEALLRRASVKNDRVFRGHQQDVNSISLSQDGKYAVSASDDGTIRIWDVKLGRQLFKTLQGHNDRVNYASFSSDGKYVISASDDKTIRVWDIMYGCQVGEPMFHDNSVDYVAYSQDGTQAISVSDALVWIWDLDTRKRVGEPREPNEYVISYSTLVSPNGKMAVSDVYGADNIVIWDIETGETISRISNRYLSASTSSFSQDGKFLAIASDYSPDTKQDCSIQVWNLDTQTMIVLEGHSKHIINTSFTSEGSYVISTSFDNTLRLWNIVSGKEIDRWYLGENWYYSSLTPDGEIVIVSNEVIKIIDADNNKFISAPRRWSVDEYPNIFPISNNKALISQSWGGWIMDIDKGEVDTTIRIDGTWKHIRSNSKLAVYECNEGIVIWDVKTSKKYKADWLKHDDYIMSLSLSRDNKYLISASADSTVKIWNINDQQQIGKSMRHSSKVYSAAFSNDGNFAVTGSEDGAVRIWDVKNSKQLGEPMYHNQYVSFVEFSLDDTSILSLSGGVSIGIWNIDKRTKREYYIEGSPSISSVSYSPDGKYIVASELFGEAAIYILDALTGRQVSNPLTVYAVRNDGLTNSVGSAEFTPDSRHIISAFNESFVVWDFPPLQELIDQTYEYFKNRPITLEEKRLFYL